MKSSVHNMAAAAIAIAVANGLSLVGPHMADAAPRLQAGSDLSVSVISPTPQSSFRGVKPVEVDALYQATGQNSITAVELYVDGVKVKTERLDTPETKGIISFLIDASALSPGSHAIVVRAVASDAEVVSAKSSFEFDIENSNPSVGSEIGIPVNSDFGSAPVLTITSPTTNGKVSGTVTIPLQATDPSGRAPYVSVFVDKVFKTLKNYAPYDFEWDTTSYTNGYHTVEAYGYNDNQVVGKAAVIRLYVNNPGGHTSIRTDLLDVPVPRHTARHAAPATHHVNGQAELAGKLPTASSLKHTILLASASRESMSQLSNDFTSRFSLPDLSKETDAHSEVAASPVQHIQPMNGAPITANSASIINPRRAITLVASAFDAQSPASHDELVSPDLPPVTFSTATSNVISEHTEARSAMVRTGSPYNSSAAVPSANPANRESIIELASSSIPLGDLSLPYLTAPLVPMAHATAVKMIVPVAKPRIVGIHTAAAPNAASLLKAIGQTSIWVNTIPLKIDRPIAAQDGVMFSPLRQIFEFEGGNLAWLPKSSEVLAHSDTHNIDLHIGQRDVTINNKEYMLDSAPYIDQGRTMVPLSMLPLALDVTVQYDNRNGHILVQSKN